jgi:hypothetical protein
MAFIRGRAVGVLPSARAQCAQVAERCNRNLILDL